MIEFNELKIPNSSAEVLTNNEWNGLVDRVERLYANISPNNLNLSIGDKVGIGTSSPSAKLEVNGKGGLNIDLKVNGRIQSNSNDGGLWIASDRFVGGFQTNKLGFYNRGWRLTIENNGHVGIGTTNPAFPLSLGSSLSKIKLALYQNTNGSSYYGMGVTAGRFYFNIGNPQAKYVFLDRAGSGQKAIMTINGNGTLLLPGLRNIGDHKNVQWDSRTKELGWDNSSRKDKRNIKPLEEDFKTVLKLQPRTYTRPLREDKWEIGYIAEEAASLGLKNLVFYDENGAPDGFNYRKMCLYLLEIVRDHERKLNPGSIYLEQYTEEENNSSAKV